MRLGTRNVHATLQLLDLAKLPHLVDSCTPLSGLVFTCALSFLETLAVAEANKTNPPSFWRRMGYEDIYEL